jgi:hypothetical protein
MENHSQLKSCEPHASAAASSPAEEEELELELDDPTIDESRLPPLDEEDAESPARDSGYDDLLDRNWLERAAGEDDQEDDASVEVEAFTIELNGPSADDDAAQVVDLDVGSLLTSLPGDGTELDLDPPTLDRQNDPLRGEIDGALAIGALRDMLLPDTDEDESDDHEIGDDERFPAFDDASDIGKRPGRDDSDETDDRDDLIENDDLTRALPDGRRALS